MRTPSMPRSASTSRAASIQSSRLNRPRSVAEPMCLQPARVDVDAAGQLVRLTRVVVRRVRDLVHLLVVVRDRVEQALRVAARACEIRTVADDECGDVGVAPVALAVRVRLVEAPLRKPAAQGAEA